MKAIAVNIDRGECYDVLCDRNSKWGNPFSHLPKSQAKFRTKTRKEAIEKYKVWFWKQPELVRSLHEFRGKRLGCHCVPKPCHVAWLADLANQAYWLD